LIGEKTGATIVNWIAERIAVKTGNWTEGKIGGKIAKLTGNLIDGKIGNRIELQRWTAQTDRIDLKDQIDRIDQTDQIVPDTTRTVSILGYDSSNGAEPFSASFPFQDYSRRRLIGHRLSATLPSQRSEHVGKQ
jgi:hypothetical protein